MHRNQKLLSNQWLQSCTYSNSYPTDSMGRYFSRSWILCRGEAVVHTVPGEEQNPFQQWTRQMSTLPVFWELLVMVSLYNNAFLSLSTFLAAFGEATVVTGECLLWMVDKANVPRTHARLYTWNIWGAKRMTSSRYMGKKCSTGFTNLIGISDR